MEKKLPHLPRRSLHRLKHVGFLTPFHLGSQVERRCDIMTSNRRKRDTYKITRSQVRETDTARYRHGRMPQGSARPHLGVDTLRDRNTGQARVFLGCLIVCTWRIRPPVTPPSRENLPFSQLCTWWNITGRLGHQVTSSHRNQTRAESNAHSFSCTKIRQDLRHRNPSLVPSAQALATARSRSNLLKKHGTKTSKKKRKLTRIKPRGAWCISNAAPFAKHPWIDHTEQNKPF